ncbi:MaoC/PaaZ C-terminal domain-containing protein [Chloroflexota bacterium]
MSDSQIYYEDVAVEDELTPLVKKPTPRQLVKWAGASGDYFAIHYDKDFSATKGLPGVIVHGQLVACFLGQLATDWAGPDGSVKRLACSYRGINFPGQTITCRGHVTGKYTEEGQNYVKCGLWAENPAGENTVTAKAVIWLPSRG